ncbi:Nn.00g079040.m01.CDS01 [Neocucurbitaria sp. VM-36]
MTTVVANPPVPAQHAAPPSADGVGSSRTYAPIAPSTSSPHAVTPNSRASKVPVDNASPTSSSSDAAQHRAEGKRSPLSSRGPAPRIVVKKEPASPDMPSTARHRPQRLNLSNHNIVHSSGALTARPSGQNSANLQDMGLACLSPGFHTQDPTMREQLQRSLDVRERQRQIIEARQKHGKGGPPEVEDARNTEIGAFGRTIKTPQTSRRKGPPPGLSIAPPSHQQFASDRVIQSAPINQTFTGLRGNVPPARQLANGPSNLSQTSHIHHVPAHQTNNRLPPISDVFPEPLGTSRNLYSNGSPGHSSHSNVQPPMPSPGFPPNQYQQQPPPTSRPREYKSAEEAVQSLSGGREDLLPRLVHYGGHQPPTPPSPMPNKSGSSAYPSHTDLHRSGSTRRRGRDEYEQDNGTPPLGRQQARLGPFGAGRDSPETQLKKKEEFIGLCARAWDLFHS